MIILFDFDSLLYLAAYRIVSFTDIRGFFEAGYNKDLMREEIVNRILSRLQNQEQRIFEDIEATGVNISEVHYFLTDCQKSIRKQISSEYKAKRKRNKWTNLARKKVLETYSNVYRSDEFEADDLIYDAAKRLTEKGQEFIICSMDKDLKQIEGMHYDYYSEKVINENGVELRQVRGLSYTSKFDSLYMLYYQLLAGDSGDGVKGIPKIGKVKAKQILDGANSEFSLKRRVCVTYLDKFGAAAKEELTKNYRLLKLGTYKINY